MNYKPRLLAPGPVEVPPQVLAATAQPMLHHRTDAFKSLFLDVRSKLAKLACVDNQDVLILAGSGTASFEAGLLASVPKGSKIIGINAGKFGERWVKLARHYGYNVIEITLEWGEAMPAEKLREVLTQHKDVATVTTTHSETSTGVLHDIKALAQVIHDETPDALFMVDCVTSLSAAELKPLEWGLDAVFSGSQKGLMCPPGLAFVWLSERAWARAEQLNPSFYLDVRKERKAQREGQTAYTPAVSLILGLNVALDMLLDEGIEQVWARRERTNQAIITGANALGCQAYAKRISPAVAALRAPEGISAPDIVKGFAARGIRIAGGQDHAKPVLFRPSVLGYADAYDAITIVAALEDTLRDLKQDIAFGQGVAASLEFLSKA